ncbi:MAG TPA: NUDIX hydrolase [Solirubrobacteraceae bacterium]|nr:NUDIX hydrolase [Solirubrobacteraceae bacterium]
MDAGDPIGDVELRGQRPNRGPATPPRLAATVILLRGGARTLEVLLVRRTPKARFMGGVWVFPGGAAERADRDPRAQASASEAGALRAAAVRELREEAGVELARGAELVELSRWITPREVQIRFDTHFFLATLPPGQEPRIDGEECVDLRWFTPQRALQANREGEIELVFPTIRHLEQIAAFASADELLDHARGREVHPVQPRIALEGEVAHVLLPGDPGYEE